MCKRLLFGPVKEPPHTPDLSTGLTKDLTRREIGILVPIALACVFLGVYPRPLLNSFEGAIERQVLRAPAVAAQAGARLDDGAGRQTSSRVGTPHDRAQLCDTFAFDAPRGLKPAAENPAFRSHLGHVGDEPDTGGGSIRER